MSAAGSVVQGMSANAQGKYEAGIAKQNAALERESAIQSIKQGQNERRDYWRKVGSVKGQQVASMAANGIDVGYGTADRVQSDTQMLADEDAANLYENIHQRTRGHVINAANYKAEAKAAKQRGKAALVGSVFQAGSSLMSGLTQASQMKAKMGTSSAGNG
jgi:hypothetical protein